MEMQAATVQTMEMAVAQATNSEMAMISSVSHLSTSNKTVSYTNSRTLGGNSGLSIGKKVRRTPTETPGTYVGNIIDAVVVPLEPGSSNSVIGSPSDNGDGNGNSNSAGNGDDGNASGSTSPSLH